MLMKAKKYPDTLSESHRTRIADGVIQFQAEGLRREWILQIGHKISFRGPHVKE